MVEELKDISSLEHEYFMRFAVEEAIAAGERGDKPIGAVLVHHGKVIAKASNQWNTKNSKVHHAENCLVMENAQYLRRHSKECIIYTTTEPCIMCIGTIVMADIRNVVIGTEDPHMHTKDFIQSHVWLKNNIHNYITGVRREDCEELILDYCDEKTIARLLKGYGR